MLRQLARFRRAKKGLAAVEFALLAPVMVTVFFGVIELAAGVDCHTRVETMAFTGADLVGQETTVSTSDVNNVFSALNAILFPYPTASATIVISSIVDAGNNTAKVAWSNAQNGTPRSVGSVVSVPAGLIVSGSGGSVILAEVTYTYTSPTTQFVTGPITMTSSFYTRPRRSLTVTHS